MTRVISRVTTPEGDLSMDVFVSQNSFVQGNPPSMVAQAYRGEDYEGASFISETEAVELRNHLDAFIRWCAKQPNRKVEK